MKVKSDFKTLHQEDVTISDSVDLTSVPLVIPKMSRICCFDHLGYIAFIDLTLIKSNRSPKIP